MLQTWMLSNIISILHNCEIQNFCIYGISLIVDTTSNCAGILQGMNYGVIVGYADIRVI